MKKLLFKSFIAFGLVAFTVWYMQNDEKVKTVQFEKSIYDNDIKRAFKTATGKELPDKDILIINEDRKKLDWIKENYKLIIVSDTDTWLQKMNSSFEKKRVLINLKMN